MANVHIVKIKNGSDSYHVVEEEKAEEEETGEFLHECDTQEEAIDWAETENHTVKVHRERNRKPTDKHGQFRSL